MPERALIVCSVALAIVSIKPDKQNQASAWRSEKLNEKNEKKMKNHNTVLILNAQGRGILGVTVNNKF